jgi:hypothetical protein
MSTFSTEFISGPARLRVDVHGAQVRTQLLENLAFLKYRLAAIELASTVQSAHPHLIWYEDEAQKSILLEDGCLILRGDWYEGEIQKILVSMLAMELDKIGLHPFHSCGVRYRDTTILFLGGENNHGKTMCQIEGACRGGQVISTETMVIDDRGWVVQGSKTTFLRERAKGTERSDLADQDEGVAKLFGKAPEMAFFEGESNVDLIIMPAIDGHFSTQTKEMGLFESEYHSYHSMMNFMGLNQLVSPGLAMPIVDSDERRRARAEFCHRWAEVRPFYMVRAATPQRIFDEVEKILDRML